MSEIIADKIRLEFLSRCRQMAEECLQDSRCELREQEGEILGETIKELEQVIGPLAEKYWEKKEEGETGGLENIYLSFLRTGILDGGPWYRIDLYDARDRVSEAECSENLKLSRILKPIKEGMRRIREEWEKQAKVNFSEWDALAYQMAERYKPFIENVLERAVTELLKERGKEWLGEQETEFWIGEFLDRAERVCRWEDGRVVAKEELARRDEAGSVEKEAQDEWE